MRSRQLRVTMFEWSLLRPFSLAPPFEAATCCLIHARSQRAFEPALRRTPSPARVVSDQSLLSVSESILDDVLLANGRLVHLVLTGAPLKMPVKFLCRARATRAAAAYRLRQRRDTSLSRGSFCRISTLSPGRKIMLGMSLRFPLTSTWPWRTSWRAWPA